tara:strand:+ start:626 stop:1540 length:915 start_codon:yes stop_codon:yes gene_type:complete
MNILLLSAGGPTAHGAIKSLRDIDFDGKIVSVDSNPLSAGFYLSDSYYVIPKAFESGYIDELLQIVEDENIDLILPTSSNDIVTISENSHLFDCQLFMSDYEAINICSDKLKFYEKCKDKFPLPKTSMDYHNIDYPLFAKPKEHSAGSRGISLCKTIHNVNCLNTNKYKYIYQEYLPGMEYTIDVLCDMDSNPLAIVPRERLQTKAGISSKGRIVKNNFIEKSCFEICKFLKLKGPLCLQMKEDINGNPKFVEINPRLGGSSYFATLAGINFLEIILDLVNGKKPIINKPKPITILRYYNEVVI